MKGNPSELIASFCSCQQTDEIFLDTFMTTSHYYSLSLHAIFTATVFIFNRAQYATSMKLDKYM